MIGARISEMGTSAFFEQREPRVDEIIAALVDETMVTLKRLVQGV